MVGFLGEFNRYATTMNNRYAMALAMSDCKNELSKIYVLFKNRIAFNFF